MKPPTAFAFCKRTDELGGGGGGASAVTTMPVDRTVLPEVPEARALVGTTHCNPVTVPNTGQECDYDVAKTIQLHLCIGPFDGLRLIPTRES